LAGEAFETLSENRWSRRDCTEYQEELDWAMRTYGRVCGEVDTASMPAKMRRMARARLDRVNSEYQRATRVVERLLQAHGGRPEERRPPAGGGYREEQKYRDDFCNGRSPDSRMECEDSIPMERRSTLPVNEILAYERQERSWENAAMRGRWGHPSAAGRGRGVGDLDMAGLNVGAPTRLQRGGRALQPAGASTPLGGDSGELLRMYSGSSARADYRRRLKLNTQDSDEDVPFRREMNYPDRGAGGFSGLQRAGAGESRGSPPVQQLDESEYPTASEADSERGRRRHRGYQDDRPSAGREDVGRSFNQENRRPAGCRGEDPDPPIGAGYQLGSGRPWADTAADGPPMPPQHSASAPLPPRGPSVGLPPRRGESMQQPRRDQGASQAAPPVLGLGLEAIQGMTNAMNAIANQVIRNSGRSVRNAGWPYFDCTFRDYPAFKRKFESFQMTYHRGTPTRELFQFHDPITIEPADCRKAAKTGRFKLNGKEHPFEMNVRQGVTVDLVGGLDNYGNCEVGVCDFKGVTLKNQMASAMYEIYVRQEWAGANDLTGTIKLSE
jgi:hypothetical protein